MTKKILFTACLTLGLNANAQELDIVKNIHPTSHSYAQNFTKLPNGKFVFSAYTQDYGYELWISDGTNQGTEILKDINLGSNDSYPNNFYLFQDKIYFNAQTNDEGIELWVSDGTQAGTQMLKDINPGGNGSYPENFYIFQNKLYFRATDGIHGDELWVTDGTQNGTQMLKDINPGNNPSFPNDFTVLNNKLYFIADNGTNGMEIWESDGTENGTKLFYDIVPGPSSSYPQNLMVFNNKLLFVAYFTNIGNELWITDGAEENTRILKDINIGNSSSYPESFVEFNGKLFFSAYNGIERTLFSTDGTSFGTVQMFENLGSFNHNVENLVKMKDKLYFRGTDPISGNYVIKYTNGIYNHYREIIDMVGTPEHYGFSFTNNLLVINDSVMYLNGNFSSMGYELYKITDVAYASLNNIESDEAFTIFPNPTSSVINISLKNVNGTQHVKIIDVAGVEVFSNEYNANENNILIDVNNLNSGVYFVKINDTLSQKFVKQ